MWWAGAEGVGRGKVIGNEVNRMTILACPTSSGGTVWWEFGRCRMKLNISKSSPILKSERKEGFNRLTYRPAPSFWRDVNIQRQYYTPLVEEYSPFTIPLPPWPSHISRSQAHLQFNQTTPSPLTLEPSEIRSNKNTIRILANSFLHHRCCSPDYKYDPFNPIPSLQEKKVLWSLLQAKERKDFGFWFDRCVSSVPRSISLSVQIH